MLFLSFGLSPEKGGEVGLSYAFISHTMQLVIMLVMGAYRNSYVSEG